MSKFNKDHLAYVLYTAPRIVNEDNLALVSQDVMKAMGWPSSDSPDGVNMYSNIEYGLVHPIGERRRFGLKLKDAPIFLADIFEEFKKSNIPAEIIKCWKIKQEEWQAVIGVMTMILKSLESYGTQSAVDSMPVFHRSLTYKLYATSQVINETLLPLLKQPLLDEIQDYQVYVDYGLSIIKRIDEYKVFGFKTRISHIPFSELLSWELPTELESKFPILAKQGAKENIPSWWKKNYADSPNDWDKTIYPSFENLWSAVVFAVYQIISAFEKIEEFNRVDLPYEDRANSE